MAADCAEAGRNLRLELRMERAARAAVAAPPSIRYEDYPAEVGKRESRVSDAAARIAHALHLHRDGPVRNDEGPQPTGWGPSSRVDQWNESPHAQEPVALGLSIVKPCFSMVSTKSISAPLR